MLHQGHKVSNSTCSAVLHNEVRLRAQARLGTVIGRRFRLDSLLGVGGMAAVFSATRRDGGRVAVKMLHAELALTADVLDRLSREARIARSVKHPGIVRVLESARTTDGIAYIVMDLIEGETLDQRTTRLGPLPLLEVLAVIDQILAAIQAAHEQGVVHRDLKPANLMLDYTGRVRVLDFGIAGMNKYSTPSVQLGSISGTPAFMAPEHAMGKWDQVDARTDIWSIGATAFNLLTGCRVHVGTTANEVLGQAMLMPARSVTEVMPELPPPSAAWVDKSLQFQRSERYQSAIEAQAALRGAYSVITNSRVAPIHMPLSAQPLRPTLLP